VVPVTALVLRSGNTRTVDLGIAPLPIEFTLLGGFALRVGGRAVEGLPRKSRALLAYLAAEPGRRVSREAIADLLWTDRGAEQARHSLRQSLLALRRALGTHRAMLHVDEEGLSLDLATWCDAALVAGLCRTERISELLQLLDLYRGPLLAGFPPIAAGFDEWLGAERDALASAALAALERLADLLAAAGEVQQAVAVAERMVALDSQREDLHRRLMTAYADASRRGDALRQYDSCVRMLRREFDVSPTTETRALAFRIKRDDDVASDDVAPHATVATQSGPPWLAVLPFRALTPDTVPSYFAAGLTEDVIAALAALREPVVISHGSTLAYRDAPADPREVGRVLGVRYSVSGSLRRAGSRLRVASELAECDRGTIIWAGSHDIDDSTELFETQDHLVARIVATMTPALHTAELRRVRVKPPNDMSAYDLVLQARDLIYQLARTDFERAGALLRQAVTRDPDYAGAWALAAEWHSLRVGQGWSDNPAADAEAVDRCASAAIAHDATNARALAFHGHSHAYLRRDHDAALALFERALDANPNSATAWIWSSPTLAYAGDGAAAVRHAKRGLRLSPRDPFVFRSYAALSLAHYTAGESEAAVHWGQLSMRENPSYTSNLRVTTAALASLGRTTEARGLGRQLLALQPRFRVGTLIERHPYRDHDRRTRLAKHLIAAGLPA
jgi:DNA-binding SARP family transcriptional activator